MVKHELFLSTENASGFHGSSALWAKYTLGHDTSAHVEDCTVVAVPIIVRDSINTVASLMNRDVASATEDD